MRLSLLRSPEVSGRFPPTAGSIFFTKGNLPVLALPSPPHLYSKGTPPSSASCCYLRTESFSCPIGNDGVGKYPVDARRLQAFPLLTPAPPLNALFLPFQISPGPLPPHTPRITSLPAANCRTPPAHAAGKRSAGRLACFCSRSQGLSDKSFCNRNSDGPALRPAHALRTFVPLTSKADPLQATAPYLP